MAEALVGDVSHVLTTFGNGLQDEVRTSLTLGSSASAAESATQAVDAARRMEFMARYVSHVCCDRHSSCCLLMYFTLHAIAERFKLLLCYSTASYYGVFPSHAALASRKARDEHLRFISNTIHPPTHKNLDPSWTLPQHLHGITWQCIVLPAKHTEQPGARSAEPQDHRGERRDRDDRTCAADVRAPRCEA